jgi:ADP-glucose pyrophosphorylase
MRENPSYLVVLSGDHVYKMDYARMLRLHQERHAAVTLATIEVPIAEANRFGIIAVDDADGSPASRRKPKQPDGHPGSPDFALALDGRLHLRHRRAGARARGRTPTSRPTTISARTSSRR